MTCATVFGISVLTAQAGPDQIEFPKDYKSYTNYLSMARTENDKQIIRFFANDIALNGAKTSGELPNGSILVGEIYKAKLDKDGNPVVSSLGRKIRGKLAAIAVMQKEAGLGDPYPENLKLDNWEFSLFSPDGKFIKKDFNKCRECHAPLKETKFLFSYEHLKQ